MGNKKSKKQEKIASSFRDPSGFLYLENGALLRQINKIYKQDYDFFMVSGLYKKLVKKRLLVAHNEKSIIKKLDNCAYKIIRPEVIPFISYPYEWCFSQLKDAALTTLKIQKIALNFNMSLKDASAYNIQFLGGKPILIDTLSFEKYKEGEAWIGYRQFCRHFLAPLALASYVDIRLIQLLRIYIDGIPLDLASKLLPKKSLLNIGILTHLHIHSKSQKKYESKNQELRIKNQELSRKNLIALIDNLYNTVNSLQWKKKDTEWGDYYTFTNYSNTAFKHKKEVVKKIISNAKPKIVWDLGANTGEFSRIASSNGSLTIAFDIDPLAVEKNYKKTKTKSEKNILPLILDLNNPSPSLGWAHKERNSIAKRGPADMIMALALIHHLAISNNLPFKNIASFFSNIGKYLIIEFVPKNDSQVKKLLSTRKDIFNNYTQEQFEKESSKYYKILDKQKITNSLRTIYLLKKM
jgi:ribosomal protein L11 methylase PrmA